MTGFSTLQSALNSIFTSPSWLLVPVYCVLELEHRADTVHGAVLLLKSIVSPQQRQSDRLLSLHCELDSPKPLIPLDADVPGLCALSRKLTRADLASYVDTHFKAPRMVLAAAGGKF